MLEKKKFYINGEWVDPVNQNNYEVINPSTEEVCAIISLGSSADTDVAVKYAKQSFETWKESSKEERIRLLERLLERSLKRLLESLLERLLERLKRY